MNKIFKKAKDIEKKKKNEESMNFLYKDTIEIKIIGVKNGQTKNI